MKRFLKALLILAVVLLILAVGFVVLRQVVKTQSHSRVVEQPLSVVVEYFSSEFSTNVTSCVDESNPVWTWGPSFLDTGTVYWVDTLVWIPEQELQFNAWFAQIGSEDNTFTIKMIDDTHTSIKVNQFADLLFMFSSCGDAEKEMLSTFEERLKPFTKETSPEQSPGGDVLKAAPQE